jgi:hypothetical protein
MEKTEAKAKEMVRSFKQVIGDATKDYADHTTGVRCALTALRMMQELKLNKKQAAEIAAIRMYLE